ncbi:hypothetical protein K457DRAFT_35543 [Linnemannia elongata AG-77]|uniref:Lytic polysaccharide monooxygenase n=1 Tax=Linnemannia elongata AG-77 TaxID=1314771 RepID=A0A197JIQ7_9FUNG|nr:hypothetical protein K457DRAFT_35543 [Linnemannia elongata AG-77]
MLFRTTVIASAALALVATMVEAHSWADCVDWRFNDPAKPGWRASDGKCFGYARQYPVNSGVQFGGLDSYSPSRHYHQDPKDFIPCSDHFHGIEPGADETRQSPISKAYGGRFGVMATATAGQKMCIRWPAKNHAKPTEPNNPVWINMPQTILAKDPNQTGFTAANIAKLNYKNCNQIDGDTDHTPCGGCFDVPANLASGTYVIQWRWMLNKDEYYASCWDLQVNGASGQNPSTPSLGNSTSIFADLAEDN